MIIVVEGLDGAGTTTQSKLLVERLNSFFLKNSIKRKAIWTNEPSDSDIGTAIRRYLSSGQFPKSSNEFPFLTSLFVADRQHHLNSLDLNSGNVFVFDRYYLSNMVYQSNEVNFKECYSLNSEFPPPELTIFIDTDPNKCIDRISNRDSTDIFENLQFLEQARKTYLSAIDFLKQNYSQKFEIINDNDDSIEVNSENIFKKVISYLKVDDKSLLLKASSIKQVFEYSGVNIVNGPYSWVTPNVPSDERSKAFVNINDRTTQLVCIDILSKFESKSSSDFFSCYHNNLALSKYELINKLKKLFIQTQ